MRTDIRAEFREIPALHAGKSEGSVTLRVWVLDRHESNRLSRTPRETAVELVGPLMDAADGLVTPLEQHALDPALTPLGPWRPPSWMRSLGTVTELSLGDGRPSQAFVSTTHAFCGAEVLAFTEVLAESESPDGDGWSTVVTGGSTVLKADVAATDYLERSQVLGEARFLTRQVTGPLREHLPRVHARHTGRGVNALVRDRVAGASPLADPSARHSSMARALLADQIKWAEAGLHHNDLRPWNLLTEGTDIRLIDFADSGDRDADVDDLPQVVALAGLLAWLLGMELTADHTFAGCVRAQAETVLGTDLSSVHLGPDLWEPSRLTSWMPLLMLPAEEAFTAMVSRELGSSS